MLITSKIIKDAREKHTEKRIKEAIDNGRVVYILCNGAYHIDYTLKEEGTLFDLIGLEFISFKKVDYKEVKALFLNQTVKIKPYKTNH